MKTYKRLIVVLAMLISFSSLAGCQKEEVTIDLPETTEITEETVNEIGEETDVSESTEGIDETVEKTVESSETAQTTALETQTSSVVSVTPTPTARPTAVNTDAGADVITEPTEVSLCPACGNPVYWDATGRSHCDTCENYGGAAAPTSTPRPTSEPIAAPTPAYTETRFRAILTLVSGWTNQTIAVANENGVTLPNISMTYTRYQYSDGRVEYDFSNSGYSGFEDFQSAVYSLNVTMNGHVYYCTNYGDTGDMWSSYEALIDGVWQPV